MPRKLSLSLLACLCLACAFCAWQWWRPYDPAAKHLPYRINDVAVERDESFCWVEISLRGPDSPPSQNPPLTCMRNADGRLVEPADVRYDAKRHSFQIRFWIELAALEAAWTLALEQEHLRIKEQGAVKINNGQSRQFHQPNW